MKNLFITAIVLTIATMFSCSNEEIVTIDEPHPVESRQSIVYSDENISRDDVEERIRCFNSVEESQDGFEERFGILSDAIFKVVKGDEIHTVYPILKNEIVSAVVWNLGNESFLLSKEKEVTDKQETHPFSEIFEFSNGILKGELSNLDNENFTIINSNGNIHTLSLANDGVTPIEVYGKAIDFGPCRWRNEWLDIYYDILGIQRPDNVDEIPTIDYRVMESIINSISPCACPIVNCVFLNAIDARDDVPESVKFQLVDNYIMSTYNLDPITVELMDREVRSFLTLETCKPTIEGCEDNEITPTDLTIAFLSDGTGTVDGILDQLTDNKSWFRKVDFDTCPKLNCVFEQLFADGMCEGILASFEALNNSGQNFGIEFVYDKNCRARLGYNDDCTGYSGGQGNLASTQVKGLYEEFSGGTYYEPYTRQIYNKFVCSDLSSLQMASLLMHETLHSEFHRLMFETVPGHINISSEVIFKAGGPLWNRMVENEFGLLNQTNAHRFMYEVYGKNIIDELMRLNHDTDNSEENRRKYLYLVLDYIAPDESDKEDLISEGYVSSQAELDELKELSETLISNSIFESICP